jgi:hypothetical protein
MAEGCDTVRTSPTDDTPSEAAAPLWPARVAEFTRWVAEGPVGGRKLTQAGRLTMADARHLVERLATGDVIDPVIGDRTFRTKSSEELTGLHITLEWAKAARLVRRRGNTLVAVKKHAALVDRPTDLLTRMVTVLGDLGPAVCPSGWGQSILHDDYPVGVRLLLTAMDLHPDGVDVPAVIDHAWAALSPLYRTGDLTTQQLDGWRRCLARDVWRTVELLVQTGLLDMDLTLDREQRRAATVPVTELGRHVFHHLRGGPAAGESVLQLRIELVDTHDPLVWRRVLVPATSTLADLHAVIQAAMGWHNAHLHHFRIAGRHYGPQGVDVDLRPEEDVHLDHVIPTDPAPATPIVLDYLYDFGDDWEHRVEVEAVTAADPGARYPRCTDGHGACPPEDCGGIPGYQRLRATLTGPPIPEQRELLQWLGLAVPTDFDLDAFDPHDADARLAALTWATGLS